MSKEVQEELKFALVSKSGTVLLTDEIFALFKINGKILTRNMHTCLHRLGM